jgi:hypothetical protein
MDSGYRHYAPVFVVISTILSLALLGGCDAWSSQPTPTPESQQSAEPTAGVFTAEPLLLRDWGFAQEDDKVAFGFVVENPNADRAIEGSGYDVVALAQDGTALGLASGIISWVDPGEPWGIGGRFTLEAGEAVTVARLEIDLRSGDIVASYPRPAFEVSRISVLSDTVAPRVTALVNNPYRLPITDVRISVVTFGQDESVTGGGLTYAQVLPGEARTGVEISLGPVPTPLDAKIYVERSSLSQFVDPEERPEDAARPTLEGSGFTQAGRNLVWGGKVVNPNSEWGHVGLRLHLTTFDDDGRVVSARDGTVRLLFPGQALGLVEEIWLAPEISVSRVDAVIVPGVYIEAAEIEALPHLSLAEGSYEPGDLSDEVVGVVSNPTDITIRDLRVVALLYDADDQIVGGGTSWLDVVPAGDTVPVRVGVVGPVAATPERRAVAVARVEIHTQIRSITQYE